jgi:hypothetical protein
MSEPGGGGRRAALRLPTALLLLSALLAATLFALLVEASCTHAWAWWVGVASGLLALASAVATVVHQVRAAPRGRRWRRCTGLYLGSFALFSWAPVSLMMLAFASDAC